jgi:hypothetical protein
MGAGADRFALIAAKFGTLGFGKARHAPSFCQSRVPTPGPTESRPKDVGG